MASEPAEPTTRQDEAAHEGCGADGCVTFGGCGGEAAFEATRGLLAKAATVVHSVRYTSDKEPTAVDDLIVQALADEHLLADPAQTTELERLRARVEELTDFAGEQANARRESDRVRNIAAREAADLRDERDTARTQLAEKTEYAGEKAREGDVMGLEIEELTAERDRLSLLLRGMARKLVESRRFGRGWHDQWMSTRETVRKLRAELDGAHLTLDTMAGRLNQARAERDERQARIDAATAELKKWDALATRESEWMPCRAALAALVGDQAIRRPLRKTTALPRLPAGETHALGACSCPKCTALPGEALRAVEEADDDPSEDIS